MIAIKITNLADIKSAFAKAPLKMVTELNTAIKKSVILVQRESMKKTPVLTGRLRASHQSLFENLKGVVSTNTTYDIFVHWGTSRMKGRPFLLDAVNQEQDTVNMNFETAVKNTLDSIAKDSK